MNARTILKRKGNSVVTVSPAATIRESMYLFARHRIGALVVQDSAGVVVGIITERDILRLTYEHGGRIMDIPVDAVMTRNLIIAVPDDSLEYLKSLITGNRIRHLPVMDDGRLIGIISIGDVLLEETSEIAVENRYLKNYIAGNYPA